MTFVRTLGRVGAALMLGVLGVGERASASAASAPAVPSVPVAPVSVAILAPEADPGQLPYESLSGRGLVERLLSKEHRDRAYYELWRRDGTRGTRHGYVDFDDFWRSHRNADVVVCPQGSGQDPIYIVLYDYLTASKFSSRHEYPTPDEGLFPPAPLAGSGRGNGPAIDAFNAEGKAIAPFGGDNVLEGTLADINGDGIVERVEVVRHAIEGVAVVDVLCVTAVNARAKPLLIVLLNWGGEEWTFRVQDPLADGVAKIELGPRVLAGLKPRVVFRWDAQAHAYQGPKGAKGDHFRRLSLTGKVEDQLGSFRRAGLMFPNDQEAASALVPKVKPAAPPPASPYRQINMADLNDHELARRMGPGRNVFDFERDSIIRNHVPPDFWTMEPKQAALAVAVANVPAKNRAGLQFAVDDRGLDLPPEICTVAVSDSSARCYNAIDGHYFLRVDPAGSYLAYARSWSGGAVFYSIVFDQPAFDLRLCPLAYGEARHLAATIWWLNRVRSRCLGDKSLFPQIFSTGDGFGRITFRDGAGRTEIDFHKTLWSGQLSERWPENFNQEAFVNITNYLVTEALPERLGKLWTDAKPRHDQNNYLRQDHGPLYTSEELLRFGELANRFLGWYSPMQDRLSGAIVACAAEAAGTLVMPEAKSTVQKILAELPAEAVIRTADEVSEEYYSTLKIESNDPVKRAIWEAKVRALEAEEAANDFASSENGPAHLSRIARIVVRKIETANDSAALYEWAIAKEPGSQWAMQRLALRDPPRYSRALEWWLNHSETRWARQLFEEIVRVDPARAAEVAASLPPTRKEELAVAAFALLQGGNGTGDGVGVKDLLAAVLRPGSGWVERGKAIDLLVPVDDPLRFPQRDVDDVLLRVLEPEMADANVNFTFVRACRALALRQRTETFGLMARRVGGSRDPYIYGETIGTLALLAQADPGRLNPQLAALVAPQLKATNYQMANLLWAIWAADLRDLLPTLERLGTGDPDDYEDRKALSSGGNVSPVEGRFHLARKIADIWNAPDAFAQIRLLTAFALAEPFEFGSAHAPPERRARLKMELRRLSRDLDGPTRLRLEGAIRSLFESSRESTEKANGPVPPWQEERERILVLILDSVAI